MPSLRLDLTIDAADLEAGLGAFRAHREYLLAILANLESRKGGYDAAEAVALLSRANALERLRLDLTEALRATMETRV